MMSAENAFTSAQRNDLRTVAAMIIPASTEYAVPGADDAAIQADILKSLGRDTEGVRAALDHLARLAGKPLAELDTARRDAVAKEFRAPRAVSDRLHAGGGRLVVARAGQVQAAIVAAGAVSVGLPCGQVLALARMQ